MTDISLTTRKQRGAARTHKGVLVRDLPVRVFHWSLVTAVFVALATGWLGGKQLLFIHVGAGVAILGLVIFRILWWFLGGRNARFSAYPLHPDKVKSHLRGLLRGRSHFDGGHNPAGAWMIVALIGLLGALALSGLAFYGGREAAGPFRALVSFAAGEAIGEVHESLAIVLAAAIALHLGGVFMETKVFGHPLLAAMTKGRVKLKEARGEAGGQLILRGLFVAALVAAGLWMANQALAGLPDARWRPLKVDAAYAENCGDCHFAYHPSLRTAAGWRRIMAGLADHFGEDATVSPEDAKRITAWLVANSAETFDTQAAVRIGRALAKGDRLTGTAFWKHRHRHIPKSVFASRAVGAKSNCKACHGDAESGRFTASKIHIPTTTKEKKG